MIKTILLLTPVYVTLFWSILLNFQTGSSHSAKRFLGKFMLACVVVYLTHFLYFSRLTGLVRIFEPFYQLASLSVYPLFYIYFRMLFVEKNFSIRKHGRYLILPLSIAIPYSILVFSLPEEVFIQWLYRLGPLHSLPALKILDVFSAIIAVVFVAQVVLTVTANLKLINAHQKKAGNYFADFHVIRSKNIVVLNIVLVVCGLTSIILSTLGRKYFISEMLGITLASVIFSTMLFTIGWLGIRQKAVNPTFEEKMVQSIVIAEDLPLDHRKQLMDKITNLFVNEHIHLNIKLTIQDVAQTVGTNRTYVSSIINQHYGVNFCTFVNNFRIEELERNIKKHPKMTNQMLAESCGFGSVDSLKRAVNAKTGLSVIQWKERLLMERKNQGI